LNAVFEWENTVVGPRPIDQWRWNGVEIGVGGHV